MTKLQQAKAFFLPKLRHVLHFLMKQGIAMAGNLLYGLLCVRLLPVPDYAKFAVLFGYMGSVIVLLDIGISSTLAPLVGDQTANLQMVANYIASIRRLALKLYLIVAPLASVGFVLVVYRMHWGASVVLQMLAALLASAWLARVSSQYGSVLTVLRDRDRYYRTQIIGSLGSLSLLLIFWAMHRLNLYVGILLNVAQILYTATSYYRRARELLGVNGRSTPQQEKAIVRLAMPNSPSMIFYALQGQITLVLITVFGHSVASVANIGALSRLGQILVFFSQMNYILIEPFFASLPVVRLKRMYLLALALVTAFATAFSALAFYFPQVFLWILGPHYSQLRVEVTLAVVGSAIRYVSGFMWAVHSARRFVYWWNTIANIVCTLLVQALFIWKFDLSTVRSVLIFNIVSAVVSLLVCASCGVYGFWRGPQRLPDPEMHEGAETAA